MICSIMYTYAEKVIFVKVIFTLKLCTTVITKTVNNSDHLLQLSTTILFPSFLLN